MNQDLHSQGPFPGSSELAFSTEDHAAVQYQCMDGFKVRFERIPSPEIFTIYVISQGSSKIVSKKEFVGGILLAVDYFVNTVKLHGGFK